VLRELKNVWFDRRLTGYVLMAGETPVARWRRGAFRALCDEQRERPVALGDERWAFEGRFYAVDDGLRSEDVLALVRDRERRAARRLERAHAALAADTAAPRRAPIPREVRLAVFERDGGRCVQCGSRFDLQYDHVIPVVLGGASTAENLQILCAPCNQSKGPTIA
jgi:5-methylcytosine-specific restriction endonuclease McrA